MKTVIISLVLLVATHGYGQDSTGFNNIAIDKTVREYPYHFDLSSPLKAFLTLTYITVEGKDNLLRSVYTVKNRASLPDTTAKQSEIPADQKKMLLDSRIREVMIYKDSIAFVITEVYSKTGAVFSTRSFYLENGNWVSSGENILQSYEDARFRVFTHIDLYVADYESIQDEFYKRIK